MNNNIFRIEENEQELRETEFIIQTLSDIDTSNISKNTRNFINNLKNKAEQEVEEIKAVIQELENDEGYFNNFDDDELHESYFDTLSEYNLNKEVEDYEKEINEQTMNSVL